MNIDKSRPDNATPDAPKPLGKIKVTTQFDRNIYNKVCAYRKKHGLSHDQDVIRLAVSYWLEKNNF